MSVRSWIAFLLLINYLIVVGAGCMNQPEDHNELILVKTSEEGHHYQQCRYLRMDGLELFLIEALANRYQNSSETAKHYLLFTVYGVDVHHLPVIIWPLYPPAYRLKSHQITYMSRVSVGVGRILYTPPWLG